MAYNGYGEPEPPTPPQPPAPPAAGQQAAALTPAQKAGYYGETKESGSDPTRGEKHWDPQWEKRARKLLGSEAVGGLGDLYDPEHRRRINKMMRKAKRKAKDKAAAKPATEEPTAEPETGGAEPAPTGQKPVGQGTATQIGGRELGGDIDWSMPTRQVPGEEPTEPGVETPGEALPGPGDQDAGAPSAGFPGGQTGLWGPEDQARAGEQAGGLDEIALPGGNMAAGSQDQAGREFVTNAGPIPVDYPQVPSGGNMAQPTSPWPPPPVQPTFYTGGM